MSGLVDNQVSWALITCTSSPVSSEICQVLKEMSYWIQHYSFTDVIVVFIISIICQFHHLHYLSSMFSLSFSSSFSLDDSILPVFLSLLKYSLLHYLIKTVHSWSLQTQLIEKSVTLHLFDGVSKHRMRHDIQLASHCIKLFTGKLVFHHSYAICEYKIIYCI